VTPGSYFLQTAHNVMVGASDQNETAVNKKLFGRHAVTVSNEDLKDICRSAERRRNSDRRNRNRRRFAATATYGPIVREGCPDATLSPVGTSRQP